MRIRIHNKILLIFGIISAIILLGIFIYLNSTLRENTYQRIRTNLLNEVSLSKYILEKSYKENVTSSELDDLADEIGKDLHLRVTIIGLDGTVLGDSELDSERLRNVESHLNRPEVRQALRSKIGESRRFSRTLDTEMLYIASVFGKEKPEGIIRLSIPLFEIKQLTDNLSRLLVFSLLLAFGLTMLVTYVASIFVSRPIKQMSLLAKRIARGEFPKTALVSTNDEIGDLAKAFDFMSEQIRERIEELTLSRSRLEAVLLSMFEGVMVVDSKGEILLINQTLKDFLSIKEGEAGKRPLEIIRNIEVQEIVDQALRSERNVVSKEISIFLPDEKVLSIHAAPIKREGVTEGAILVFHDITELRMLEKIRQDFVANVSHELRTPVSNIKGYAETLLEGALEDKKNAADFLKIIYSESDRLAKLIDDILDLSKIESGKLKMTFKPCALKSIVRRIVLGMEKQAKEKSVSIELIIPEDMPDVLADEARMAQVLLNLLDNAVKFNKEGGKIIISAKQKNGFVQVDVSDTGVGIPEKDLSRIFERFYRVDKARSRELGGTGLGLSIVKHIVQAHDGQVWSQSVLGQGSTFSFTIPKA